MRAFRHPPTAARSSPLERTQQNAMRNDVQMRSIPRRHVRVAAHASPTMIIADSLRMSPSLTHPPPWARERARFTSIGAPEGSSDRLQSFAGRSR